MAEHRLTAAYRDDLLIRLPAHLADEVSDGLADAQEKYLAQGLTPGESARAAIAEFGSPGVVADAFRRASPAWSAARGLILTGPVVGGLWAAALITGHAWLWPVPPAIRARSRHRSCRLGAHAGHGTPYPAIPGSPSCMPGRQHVPRVPRRCCDRNGAARSACRAMAALRRGVR